MTFNIPDKRLIDWVRGLHKKAQRETEGLFLAEGEKCVQEFLSSGCECKALFVTQEDLANKLLQELSYSRHKESALLYLINKALLERLSTLKSTANALGVFKVPDHHVHETNTLELLVCGLQDPGNLGTLIRSAHWFGLKKIHISPDCVEPTNPKTVQASMGSLAKISLIKTEPVAFINQFKSDNKSKVRVIGLMPQGRSLYETHFANTNSSASPVRHLFVLGNEGRGIPDEILSLLDLKISVPPTADSHPESLNATIAASIFLAEFRRQEALLTANIKEGS